MPIASACVDSKIVSHSEQPCFGVIERAVLAEAPEESQEGLLCDVLRLSGIPRFSQDVSKHWDAKLFEQGKHCLTQRHRVRSPVGSQRERPFGEYSIRRFAHVEHAYTLNARRGCFRVWGEIFFHSHLGMRSRRPSYRIPPGPRPRMASSNSLSSAPERTLSGRPGVQTTMLQAGFGRCCHFPPLYRSLCHDRP